MIEGTHIHTERFHSGQLEKKRPVVVKGVEANEVDPVYATGQVRWVEVGSEEVGWGELGYKNQELSNVSIHSLFDVPVFT